MYNDHMEKSNQWKNMWQTVILNVFAKNKTFFVLNDLCHFNIILCYIRKTDVSLWNKLCHCTHIILYFFVNYYYRLRTGRWSSYFCIFVGREMIFGLIFFIVLIFVLINILFFLYLWFSQILSYKNFVRTTHLLYEMLTNTPCRLLPPIIFIRKKQFFRYIE